MKNNLRTTVIDAISKTQDGGLLKQDCDFSNFILARIKANTTGSEDFPNTQHIELDDLIMDFNYMINELKKAIVPMENLMQRLSLQSDNH